VLYGAIIWFRYQAGQHWKDKFATAIHDQECSQVFEDKQSMRDEMLSFAHEILKSSCQPRDDYPELLELTVIFLGGTPPRGVHIMASG
jgi:hypothetical protein